MKYFITIITLALASGTALAASGAAATSASYQLLDAVSPAELPELQAEPSPEAISPDAGKTIPDKMVVDCLAKVHTKDQSVSLKMNEAGKIVKWGRRSWAQAEDDSIFYLLTLDVTSGLDYARSSIAADGYSVLTVRDTDTEVSIRIAPDKKTGLYKYRDVGSGNGNHRYPLTCAVVISSSVAAPSSPEALTIPFNLKEKK